MLPGASIVQIAWVVDDLEAAATRLSRTMQVGPFLMVRHVEVTAPIHRGVPGLADFSAALAQAGDVQIELIEQHCDNPSVYRDPWPNGPPGGMAFHHVATIVPDVAAEASRYHGLGYQTAMSGTFGTLDFVYLDSPAGGFMIELLPDEPDMHAFFGAVREAAESWDSVTPFREFA